MTEFEKLFAPSSNKQTSSAQAQGAEDEDWANVTLPSRTRGRASNIAPMAMPSLDELPRPEMLFAAQVPYHLIVKIVHNGIVVQGSHQGSLELLAGYLQQYTRNVPNVSVKVRFVSGLVNKFHCIYERSCGTRADSCTGSDPQIRASSLAFWLRRAVRFAHHYAWRFAQRLGEYQSRFHPFVR